MYTHLYFLIEDRLSTLHNICVEYKSIENIGVTILSKDLYDSTFSLISEMANIMTFYHIHY